MSEKPELDVRPHPKKTDYGIGIIGCGWVVKNYHLPAYRARGLNVVAVADLKQEELDFVREKFGIEKCFRDYREMLELREVEIIDLSIRAFGRVEIVEHCAEAGKHLLVQKPFARSMDEGRAMVAATNRAGVKLGVNSHYRWLNVFRGAWQLIQQGTIGTPYYISEEMVGDQDYVYYHVMLDRRW
ncbi:MAG: Gfo/Idh/MocA family protein, partial [Candidatus Poribacteria bacterium]